MLLPSCQCNTLTKGTKAFSIKKNQMANETETYRNETDSKIMGNYPGQFDQGK